VPRAALIRIAPRFIRATVVAPIMFCVCGRFRHMQETMSGALQQIVQARGAARIAQRQFGFDVVIDHLHAEPSASTPTLRADVAVADEAEHLAAHFEAAGGRLSTSRRDGIAFFCGIPRISRMASATTSSATLRVLE
jgi:hypothetical protein